MEYTILGCDLCPKRPRPKDAVTSRTLVNGRPRKGDPTLDLCGKHARAIERSFRPTAVRGRPRVEKVAKPARRRRHRIVHRRGAGAANLAEAETRVLAALREAGAEGLRGMALATAAKLSKALAVKAALALLKKGTIKRRGQRLGYVVKEAA